MSKIRRICLFSGACGGKTLHAANIRAQLGFRGYNVEYIEEEIKEWTYLSRNPAGADGLFLQGRQVQKEDIRLRTGVDLIVSDSPVFLQYFYATHHNFPFQNQMLEIAFEFDYIYPALNIFLERDDKFYTEQGRYETLKQAKEIDMDLKSLMTVKKIEYKVISCLSQMYIISYILKKLKENNE